MASAQPTEQIQYTSTIPKFAEPYAQQMLGNVFGGVDPATGQFRPGLVGQGYEPYKGQMFAGFTPLQQQAFESTAGMQVAPQLGQASGIASLAAQRAGEVSKYDPMQAQFERVNAPSLQQYQMEGPERVSAQTEFGSVNAPSLQQFQMQTPEQIQAEKFGTQQMQEYMSPYMEGVIERQKRAATKDFMRQIPGMGAAAARMGGRGGSREALMQSEARRGLSERMGDIQATGLQQAYQQATQQFGADRAARMQAALANQQAGLTAGQANLQSLLQTQGLGAQQSMQAALANQQARMTGGQMGLQAALANQQAMQRAAEQNLQARLGVQQLGAQQGMQASLANQQAQQQAQQLAEQSRQFGAGLGLQGLQQQLAAAGQLGQLGQQQYGQQMGIQQAQLGAGAQMQALEQQMLNQQYQDFINKQQLPYKQAEFGMGILRGVPTQTSQTMYQQPGSLFGQIAGAGLGLGNLFGSLGGRP